MNIKQFRYNGDNLAYLVVGEKEAAAIDAGAVEEILSYVDSEGLILKYVLNTHSHGDHTLGNRRILEKSGATFLSNDTLRGEKMFLLDGNEIGVIPTPGHTEDCLTFEVAGSLVTGDTLFNGTVGNCFSGDLFAFYESIKKIMAYPEDTVIYAGHDYVKESVAFARTIEDGNGHLDTFLSRYDPAHVFSRLADEYLVNPYLRFNDPKLIAIMKGRGLPVEEEYDRWKSLMEVY